MSNKQVLMLIEVLCYQGYIFEAMNLAENFGLVYDWPVVVNDCRLLPDF